MNKDKSLRFLFCGIKFNNNLFRMGLAENLKNILQLW